MEVAQLNVRIDARVKREGDAVLARLGVSATEAIRALWAYLATAQALPVFMKAQDEAPPEMAQTSDIGERGAGLALALARNSGLAHGADQVSYDELRDLAFQELLDEGVYRV